MGPEGCVHAPKGWSCETLKWECVGYKVDCNESDLCITEEALSAKMIHAWMCRRIELQSLQVRMKSGLQNPGCPAYIYWIRMDLFPADTDSDNQQHIHKVNQSRGETRAAVELSSQGQRYDFSTDVFSPVFRYMHGDDYILHVHSYPTPSN